MTSIMEEFYYYLLTKIYLHLARNLVMAKLNQHLHVRLEELEPCMTTKRGNQRMIQGALYKVIPIKSTWWRKNLHAMCTYSNDLWPSFVPLGSSNHWHKHSYSFYGCGNSSSKPYTSHPSGDISHIELLLKRRERKATMLYSAIIHMDSQLFGQIG